MVPVVDQRPMGGTVITQPVVLNTPLRLPGANKWRRHRFSRLAHAACLDQKQLAISEPKKGFATLGISASAEHIFITSCPAKHNLAELLDSELARCMPWRLPWRTRESRISGGRSYRPLSSALPTNRHRGRYFVDDFLPVLRLGGYHQSYA